MLLFAWCGSADFVWADSAHGRRGIAATVHPLATAAAIQAFQKGGNAVDAAVAAALTLGVVDGFNSGVGGGCLALVRLPNGNFIALDGRETAPLLARKDMFGVKSKSQIPKAETNGSPSQTGPLAVATPGALHAYDTLIRNHGRLPLRVHLLAAAEIAERGFVISQHYASKLETAKSKLALFEAARAVFLNSKGEPWRAGETLKQPDLAHTYQHIAAEGIAWFYQGPFAQATDEWMRRNDGVLRLEDFFRYRSVLREPVRTKYSGYSITTFPPPSSGGVLLAQMLHMLEPHNLPALGQGSADQIHLVTEVMKLAFSDRAHWLGDPDFAKVPRGLTDRNYAQTRAADIDMHRAATVAGHGMPPRTTTDVFSKHTTHLSMADADGYWVALTATINTTFGSGVVIPGTGVVMNNEMDDFAALPGVPNAFRLIGGEANAVAPGKRPLSSMTPLIVEKDGRPLLAVGAAGGPTIISQVLLTTLNWLQLGMPLDEAVAAPRWHHQWRPDELRVERALGKDIVNDLEKRGHKVATVDTIGVCQAVARDTRGGGFIGVSDPRVPGKSAGW